MRIFPSPKSSIKRGPGVRPLINCANLDNYLADLQGIDLLMTDYSFSSSGQDRYIRMCGRGLDIGCMVEAGVRFQSIIEKQNNSDCSTIGIQDNLCLRY